MRWFLPFLLLAAPAFAQAPAFQAQLDGMAADATQTISTFRTQLIMDHQQIAALQAQVSALQNQLDAAKKAAPAPSGQAAPGVGGPNKE